MRPVPLLALLIVSLSAVTASADNPLREYVQQPDDAYRHAVVDTQRLGTNDVLMVKLTSQRWRGRTWQHWLGIAVPDQPLRTDRAILIIGGGTSDDLDQPPKLQGDIARAVNTIVTTLRVPVAVLTHVPNQPAFDGLYEDALIAHTFDRYLRTGDTDWPALLPMTQSAVRAMDAVQAVLGDRLDVAPEKFIVTGASKRGWTTYLTAAADDRVAGIAPMVFDTLNLPEQMPHQWKSLGGYRDRIRDYTERKIPQRMDTPPGRTLVNIVDPLAYRDDLTMPKLILLGTNDPFWTTDAATLYADRLKGPTWLYYEPNAGHGIGLAAVPAIAGFTRALLTDQPMPGIDWQRTEADELIVRSDADQATAVQWSARSDTRDFRDAEWTSEPVEGNPPWSIRLASPAAGYAATYLEVHLPLPEGGHLRACTPIQITPDTFQHTLPGESE